MGNLFVSNIELSEYDYSEEVISILKDSLKCAEVYGVYHTPQMEIKNNYKILFDHYKVRVGDYAEYHDGSLKPLDDEAIGAMSPYDMEIMYMSRRYECLLDIHSFEERKDYYYRHLQFWNDFFSRSDIEYALFGGTPHEVYDYIAYRMCEQRGIKTCIIEDAQRYHKTNQIRFLGSKISYDGIEMKRQHDKTIMKYHSINEDDISLLEEMDVFYQDCKKLVKGYDASAKSYFFIGGRNDEMNRYMGSIGKRPSSIYNYMKTRLELLKLLHVYETLAVEPDFSKKYIYYPLQYTPERSSSPSGGGMFADQCIPIEVLSQAVPDDVYIYVKETPIQIPYGRYPSFYERVANMRNVRIVKEKTNTYDLISNCVAVSTLTGTAGYECQYFGKPFLMFGYYTSLYAPGTIHVRTVEDCRKAIDRALKYDAWWDVKDIKVYLKYIEEMSFDLRLIKPMDFAKRIYDLLGM